MIKTVKIIALIVAVAAFLGGSAYFGLRTFARSVYNQRTCEWANIDNVELHTHVNIPAIKNFDCIYKKELNVKIARFEIDKDEVEMDSYIRQNKLRKIDAANRVTLDTLLMKEGEVAALANIDSLYYKVGAYEGETFQVLLDHASGRLWVIIRYKD